MKRIILALALASTCHLAPASPSNDDLVVYHDRMVVYVGMKQTPEQIIVSLGNYFGRLGNFQVSYNMDGTVDIVYVESAYLEGQGETIRFIATVGRLKPYYVEVPR